MAGTVSYFNRASFEDIDLQAQQLAGYDQDYTQLSCGGFAGQFTNFGFENGLQFANEQVNQVIHQRASIPADVASLIYLDSADRPCSLNGASIECGDLAVMFGGDEVALVTAPTMSITVVSMPLAQLWAVADSRHLRRSLLLRRVDPLAQELGKLIGGASNGAVGTSTPATHADPAETIFKAFAHHLTLALESRHARRENRMFTREYSIVCKIRTLIEEAGGDIDLSEAIKDLPFSRRFAEKSFHKIMGMGPYRYLKLYRLNAIRRDLQSVACRSDSIGDIAARRGVWHLGRLSREYRDTFGVSPSASRRPS